MCTHLSDNCSVKPRTARAYMRLAKRWPSLPTEERQRVADLPLREAIRAIAVPEEAPVRQNGDYRAKDGHHAGVVASKLTKSLDAQRRVVKRLRLFGMLKGTEIESLRQKASQTLALVEQLLAEAELDAAV